MQSLGLHVMAPEWALAGTGTGRNFSASLRQTTLKVLGSKEELVIPVQTCTTVQDVKAMLSDRLMVPVHQLTFVYKQGCQLRTHRDVEQISRQVTVKGIKSFKAEPHQWPYPIGILGAGYHGMRTGLKWLKDGSSNFVVFDRLDRVGGHFWLKAANKHSRLQSEFASFCVWFGPEFGCDERCGGVPEFGTWATWPDRETVLNHFELAAKEYGLLPNCRFSVDAIALGMIGRKTDHSRHYDLKLRNVDDRMDDRMVDQADGRATPTVQVSGLITAPGSMTANKTVNFPGEDLFDGVIAYGMNNDLPFKSLSGGCVAVVGHGAFAVENVRTCCDAGALKVFLVTRRKNLVCPRLPSWFVHQGSFPVPGWLLLKQFERMFDLAGFGDPFEFPAVHGSRTSDTVLINQPSRFTISDVIFLAAAYGKLALVEDTVKRLSSHTVHLSERTLTRITALIKATGLVGDSRVDRLHKMKEMKGFWADGDCRRPIRSDPCGIEASDFKSLSQGLTSYYNLQQDKFFFDFPREQDIALERGLLEMLPVNTSDKGRPAYVHDAQHNAKTGQILAFVCPKIMQLTLGVGEYMHKCMHRVHPLREHLQLCREEWDEHQKTWQGLGSEHAYVPYPYTEEMVEGWIEDHKDSGGDRSADGNALESAAPTLEADQDYYDASRRWWMSNSSEAHVAWLGKKAVMKSGRR